MSLLHYMTVSVVRTPSYMYGVPLPSSGVRTRADTFRSDSPDYGYVQMNEHLPQYAKEQL